MNTLIPPQNPNPEGSHKPKQFVRTSRVVFSTFMLLTLLCTLLLSCGKFDPRLRPEVDGLNTDPEEIADASVHNFTTASYVKKTLKWNIHSDLAEVFNSKNRTYLKVVNLIFYDVETKPTSFILSDRAILLADSKDIELIDNVTIRNTKGTVVKGDYFYWNNLTQELTSPEKVFLTKSNGFTISGTGFATDKSLDSIEFTSQASGEITQKGTAEKDFFNVEF